MSKLFAAITIMMVPSLSMAHSGHGHVESTSIWHWLLEFEHVGLIIPVVIALLLVLGNSAIKGGDNA